MVADLKQGTSLLGKILASGQTQAGLVLSFSGSPTGGTFIVSVTNAQGTAATASQTYSATYAASTLQTALQGLSNVGTGNLLVAGSSGGPFTITAPAAFPCSISLTSVALTGGTSPTAAISQPDTTLYTVPAASATKVTTATVTNVAGFAVTTSLSVVPSGQSNDITRRVVYNYPITANDSMKVVEIEGAVLDAGAFIVLNAGPTLNALDYLLTGAVSS